LPADRRDPIRSISGWGPSGATRHPTQPAVHTPSTTPVVGFFIGTMIPRGNSESDSPKRDFTPPTPLTIRAYGRVGSNEDFLVVGSFLEKKLLFSPSHHIKYTKRHMFGAVNVGKKY
jgi:hypothetical protein